MVIAYSIQVSYLASETWVSLTTTECTEHTESTKLFSSVVSVTSVVFPTRLKLTHDLR
jgi:hypothetical protein